MLKISNLALTNKQLNAEEALVEIGNVLLKAGSVTSHYIENMIQSYHQFGPYFVIAPGIAIAHAKPDESVLHTDMALMVCKEPIHFNSHNDPVTLLFGLCATSGSGHIESLVQLSELLSDDAIVDEIKTVTSLDKLRELFTSLNLTTKEGA